VFTVILARENGARRLRRFHVAQSIEVADFAERRETEDGKAA
jgi:hypothetical protein